MPTKVEVRDSRRRVLPPWWLCLLGAIVAMVIYGALAVSKGQDANWDLLNYHFYNPWALLHGRLDVDVAPAQVQTYLNPALDLPAYWLIQSQSPPVVAAVLGALHGLNAWLLGLLCWSFFRNLSWRKRLFATLGSTLFGLLGLESVSLIGQTTNDNLVSLFALGALLVLFSADEEKHIGLGRWIGAGFLLGLGTGLKLTLAIHALAFGVITLCVSGAPERWRRVLAGGVSGVVGVVVSSGYWMGLLYQRFGSPVFPFWNGIFKSPYFIPESADFYAFYPGPKEGILGQLLFSYDFAREPALGIFPGSDFRFVVCLFAILACCVVLAVGRARGTELVGARFETLLWFFAISYVAWQAVFAYSRMLVVLEMLAGLLLVAVGVRLFGSSWRVLAALGLLLAVLIGFQQRVVKPHLVFKEDYFGVEVPQDLEPEAMVVVATNKPTSYVIPYFPESFRFVHISGNMSGHIRGTLFDQLLRSTIAEHTGPFYMLAPVTLPLPETVPEVRKIGYGLEVDFASCRQINRRFHLDIRLCDAWLIDSKTRRLVKRKPVAKPPRQEALRPEDIFFLDGFESGDLSAWTTREGEASVEKR